MNDPASSAGAPSSSPTGVSPSQSVSPTSSTSPRPETQQRQSPSPDGAPTNERSPPPAPAVTLSPSLAHIVEGMVIEGVVVAGEPDGPPVLRTDGGTFVVTGERPIPINARLTLKVLAVDTSILAAVLSQDGEAVHPPFHVRLTLTNLRAPTVRLEAESRLVAGAIIAGTIVGELVAPRSAVGPGPASPLSAAASALAPGSRLTFRLIELAPPPSSARQAAPGTGVATPGIAGGQVLFAAPAGAAALVPAASPSLATQPAIANATGPPGAAPGAGVTVATASPIPDNASGGGPFAAGKTTEKPATTSTASTAAAANAATAAQANGILGPDTPSAAPVAGDTTEKSATAAIAAANPPSPPAAATSPAIVRFTAVAAGHDQDGLLLVRTPAGLVRLDTREPIAEASRLELEVLRGTPSRPAASAAPVAEPGAAVSLLHDWPALREALKVVGNAPALGAAVPVPPAGVVPAPNAQFPSNLLFFLAALRLGDLAGWLGRDSTQRLERAGRGSLLKRLVDDFVQLGQLSERSTSSEWRAYAVPFDDGAQLQQLRLLTRRRHGDDDPESDQEGGMRFVIDLSLSRFGAFQLDGLIRGKHFELIVRSHEQLDDEVRRDISIIFHDSVIASGLTGSVAFRTEPAFSVSAAGEAGRGQVAEAGLVV